MIRLILLALVFGFSMVLGMPSAAANTTDTLKKSMAGDLSTAQLDTVKTQAPLVVAEVMPNFKGGMTALSQFITNQIKYPPKALDKGISGKVLIDFVVDTAGKVSNISCPNADKQHPDLIDEAIRVVKLTNGQWIPASNNGKPVKAKMRLPIVFEIE
jgi:TonB family protein